MVIWKIKKKKTDNDVLDAFFDSKNPLHLRMLPKKRTRKLEVLNIISQVFDDNTSYSEREINALLKPIYDDFVLLRRYLVDYSFLERTNSGSVYRKKSVL